MTATIKYLPPAAGAFDPTDITLTDDTSGAFLIKEGSTEYMRINTTNGAALTEFNVPANDGAGFTINLPADSGSNTGFQLLTPSGSLKFGRQAAGIYTGGTGFALDVGAGKSFTLNGATYKFVTSTTPIVFNLNDASGGSLQITDAADAEIFKVEEDSNATFTLDYNASNYFTVKSDNSANHILRINSQTRHTEIERIGYAGQQYFGYSADYCQRTQPAAIDAVTHATGTSTLAVPDMGGSPGSGTFNNINKRTAIRIHSASQSASGDLFTATLNVNDAYDQLIREMFLYVSNYDSTNNFALKIQASAGSGNWRELNSSGITSASGQTIDAATTYIYRIFQYAPGGSTATRVYGINFMGKMAH